MTSNFWGESPPNLYKTLLNTGPSPYIVVQLTATRTVSHHSDPFLLDAWRVASISYRSCLDCFTQQMNVYTNPYTQQVHLHTTLHTQDYHNTYYLVTGYNNGLAS